jgi:DNA-binding transcriptional ArsR family regulator
MKNLPLSDKMIDLVARRFHTLGEPFRLRILQLLETREHTVNELVEALDATQSNVSKHLQILFETGLVGRRRDGTSVYYTIGDPLVFKLCELVCRSVADKTRENLRDLQPPTTRSAAAKTIIKPASRRKAK